MLVLVAGLVLAAAHGAAALTRSVQSFGELQTGSPQFAVAPKPLTARTRHCCPPDMVCLETEGRQAPRVLGARAAPVLHSWCRLPSEAGYTQPLAYAAPPRSQRLGSSPAHRCNPSS